MKKLTRERVVRIISASVSWLRVTATGGALELGVAVPEGHVQVLDALAVRLAKARA